MAEFLAQVPFLLAPIDTPAGAGLANFHLAELRYLGFQPMPYPPGYIFAGGIPKARYVVEVVVIKLFIQRFEAGLQLGEIHNPASRFRSVSLGGQSYVKGMAVKARAFVPLGNIGEAVGCLEMKFLVDFHVYFARAEGVGAGFFRCQKRAGGNLMQWRFYY